MNLKTTLALLIVIAAGGLLAWLEPSLPFARKPSATAELPDQGSQAFLAQLKPDALVRIEVRQGDRATVLERSPDVRSLVVKPRTGIHTRTQQRDPVIHTPTQQSDPVPTPKPPVTFAKQWTMPGRWPVRSAEVNDLVDLLCSLKSRFQPEPLRQSGNGRADDLARFGIAPAAAGINQPAPITVILQTPDGPHTLVFGEGSASGDTNRFSRPTYVRVDDKAEVLRLAPGLLATLDRPTDYYQQRRLFAAERVAKDSGSSEKTERLLATGIAAEERRPRPADAALSAAGTALLEHPQARDTTYRLVKKDQTWEMSGPLHDRIDPGPRDTLLGAVPDLWAERFVAVDLPAVVAAVAAPDGSLASVAEAAAWLSATTPNNASAWLRLKSGLANPERVLTVSNLEGQPVTLLIGKVASVRTQRKMAPPAGPPGTPPREEIVREEYRYAQLQNNPQIFEIRADKLKDIFVDPATLRDPRLARFATADVRRLEIDHHGRPTVLVKDKDRWKLEKPIQADADSEKVNELLNKLTGLEARKDDIRDVALAGPPAASTAALQPFGLDKPSAVVKVTVDEEVKTQGGAKEKKTSTFAFAVGKHDDKAKKLYVQAEGWSRINAVDDSLLPLIERPALSYRGNRLFDFPAADLASLEIHKGEQKLTLKHEQDKWRLAVPFAAEADEAKASQLASGLSGLEVIEYVSDAPSAEELAKDGLDKPALAVAMTFADKAKAARTLQIGKARDGKPGFFAKLSDGPGVFAVNNDIRNFLDRDALAYLPAELWKIAPEEVTALRIQKGSEPEYRLTHADSSWKISGPFDATAMSEAVQSAVAQLAVPHAESYRSHDDKELAKVGLDKPVLTLNLTAASGKTHGLLIGAPVEKDSKNRYAKLIGGTAVFVVGEPVFLAADKSALDWLDPVLAKVEPARIDHIVSQSADNAVTLEKKGPAWLAVQGPGAPFTADEQTVTALLSQWLNLKAEKFAAYGTNLDLARFGLDHPTHTITVRSAEAGKPPAEHRLELGGDATGGARYARLDKGPGIVVLAPTICMDLAHDNLAFVNHTLVKLDPRAVTGITREGQGELEIVKQGEGWRLVKPVNELADDKVVQDLLDRLTDLRASRIAAYPAKDLSSFGLDAGKVTVTIKLAGEKPSQHVIRLGKLTGEQGDRFIQVDGSGPVGVLPATFAKQLVSGPLYFRDRNLVRFPDADKLRLERGPRRAAFARVDGSWKLTEPIAADADQEELDELLNGLARLRADEFVAQKPAAGALAGFGLERPEARWHVQAGGKDVLTLLVGKHEKGGPRCYAKLADRDLVFLLDSRLSAKILGEFRTRTVWSPSLDAAQVESLRYTDSRGTFLLEKNEAGAWHAVGKPDLKIVPATVTETLDALAGLRLVRYAMDTSADFKLYGLEPPELAIEIATRSGKRVLQLGRPEGGSKRFYARVLEPGRSDVFVLGEADFARIARDVTAFTRQPLTPKK